MDRLFTSIGKYKKKTALIDHDGEKYSYNDVLNQAKYLNSKIEKRSLVLILASNNIESIIYC